MVVTNEEIREYLDRQFGPEKAAEIVLLDGYEDAFCGTTFDDKVVYSVADMLFIYTMANCCSDEEALHEMASILEKIRDDLGDSAPIFLMSSPFEQ